MMNTFGRIVGKGRVASWLLVIAGAGATAACGGSHGAAKAGEKETIGAEEKAKMAAIGEKVSGTIIWSSSREGNHDIFAMDTDGSNVTRLTETPDNVDWFPRFSPGGDRILFVRSKEGWVPERDANVDGKWDVVVMNADGSDQKKVADDASWGNWLSEDEVVYVRRTKVFKKQLGGDEELVLDGEEHDALKGAVLQQPQFSKNGKYIALTLRGGKRETGVWDIAAEEWTKTGEGCQINWTPDNSCVYWVNPSGAGGSEVFKISMKDGKPEDDKLSYKEQQFVDIPGRQSHEYFPKLSADGDWMVWAATQRGHDHDTADYDIFIWEVGAPVEEIARLTFHTGNDRWPDIHID